MGVTVPLCPSARGSPGNLECRSHQAGRAHPVRRNRGILRVGASCHVSPLSREPCERRALGSSPLAGGLMCQARPPASPPAGPAGQPLHRALNLHFPPLEGVGSGSVCSTEGASWWAEDKQASGCWVWVGAGPVENPRAGCFSIWSWAPSSSMGSRLNPDTWHCLTGPWGLQLLPLGPSLPTPGLGLVLVSQKFSNHFWAGFCFPKALLQALPTPKWTPW